MDADLKHHHTTKNRNKKTQRAELMIYDTLIIGAGVAGLYSSLNLPKDSKVLIVTKEDPWNCNTFYAQGGVAVALNKEDEKLHAEDTISSGAGLCNEEAVKILSKNSREVLKDLEIRGFSFDKNENGELLYTKEAAHSASRIVHSGGDATGRYLHHFLLNNVKHPMLTGATVIDLLVENSHCYGISIEHKGTIRNIYAKSVIIAAGGVGSLMQFHTNSHAISADLQGICLTKGIELENMEMLQFHPTVFVHNSGARKLLLSEAMRGEGAVVTDSNGVQFLSKYDESAELAPRDIVSRAIFDYTSKNNEKSFLSFENFDKDYLRERFPNIYISLKNVGYDISKQRVPISPAFHYSIGGIKSDLDAKVNSFDNLFAVGEVASTGVHGANRLASNSLLEALVFARRAALKLNSVKHEYEHIDFKITDEPLYKDGDKEKKEKLRSIMWNNVGIVRTTEGLKEAKEVINHFSESDIGRLLRLRLLSAKAIVDGALKRTQSVGVHFLKKG